MTPLRLLVLGFLVTGPALAGSLDHGNWSPSGCGPEPIAPSGLNLSSQDAYKDSVKWVKAYQEQFGVHPSCETRESGTGLGEQG
jgi:hypothetical protein